MVHPRLKSRWALSYVQNCEEYRINEWQEDLNASSGKLDLGLMGSVTKGVLALRGKDYREELLESFDLMIRSCDIIRTPEIGRVNVLVSGKEVENVYFNLKLIAQYKIGGRVYESNIPMFERHYDLEKILKGEI